MNNFSLATADRTTHLKIVVVALSAATLVSLAALNLRSGDPDANLAAGRGATVVAGHAVHYAGSTSATIR